MLLDLLILLFLFLIEAFLSIDNAAVIAVLARKVPKEQQGKAIWIGIATGFLLRALVVGFTAYFLQFAWIVLIGGAYLVYIAIHHFLKKKSHNIEYKPHGFWKTVLLIEGADIVFAVDSILTAFAVLLLFYPPSLAMEKIWIVYVAGVMGMITMRFFSKMMINLLEKRPIFEHLAYILVGLVGAKLIIGYFF